MKVILIGNYPPDQQESMKLFSTMLSRGLTSRGIESEIWLPTIFFGKYSSSTAKGVGKWLGYIDKWILFPVILRIRLLKGKYRSADIIFHVCDHSNSPYLTHLPVKKTAITCHDVLAIRGAFGYEDAYCKASRFGLLLQKWILKNLVKAQKLATVSELTLQQLVALSNGEYKKDSSWQVIHNAFNEDFGRIPENICYPKIREMGMANTAFLLHIGSSLERKNRKLLVDMLHELGTSWNGIICFAGEAIDTGLQEHIIKLGLQNRVKSIVRPSHENLLALYSSCEAFIFPSFSEGFGWPVIEAQACGAPVIASNVEPMCEVSGGAALHENPHNAAGFAKAFLSLQDSFLKEKIIAQGYENCKRFSLNTMIDAYVALYNYKKN